MIVEAGAEHAAVVAALHAACFAEGWPAPEIARLMAMPGALTLIETGEGDMPLGFLIARRAADEAEIVTVGTLPAARRQGVARRLILHLREALAAGGAGALFIEVADANGPALGLYRSLGFEAVGRRKGYYQRPGGAEDALVMRLGSRA